MSEITNAVDDSPTEITQVVATEADPRRWQALIGVSLATFMTYLDNNVVNVALPTIQLKLKASVAGLEWIVSSYILVFAGLMLVGGRLADVYGRRKLFLGGLGLFTAASLMAGLAGSESILIAARALQGLGAAACIPPTLAIISTLFPDEKERAGAVALWGAVSALGLALGPVTGGLISQYWTWGWIFLINVPIGVVTIVLTAVSMSEMRDSVKHRLDLPGLATSAAALFSVTYALIEGHNKGWTSPIIVACFVIAAAMLVAFVMIEMRADDPMVDLTIFRSKVFSGGTVVMMLWGFGVMGIYFFTAMYLQRVLHLSATVAGAAFIPMALSLVAVSPAAPKFAERFGTNVVAALGITLIVVGLLAVAVVGESGHFVDLLAPFICYGIGSGLMMAPVTDAVVGELPASVAGTASAVNNAARELSALLGVTIVGAILTTRAAAVHDGSELHHFLVGYRFALVVAACIVAVGVPVAFLTLRGRQGE